MGQRVDLGDTDRKLGIVLGRCTNTFSQGCQAKALTIGGKRDPPDTDLIGKKGTLVKLVALDPHCHHMPVCAIELGIGDNLGGFRELRAGDNIAGLYLEHGAHTCSIHTALTPAMECFSLISKRNRNHSRADGVDSCNGMQRILSRALRPGTPCGKVRGVLY